MVSDAELMRQAVETANTLARTAERYQRLCKAQEAELEILRPFLHGYTIFQRLPDVGEIVRIEWEFKTWPSGQNRTCTELATMNAEHEFYSINPHDSDKVDADCVTKWYPTEFRKREVSDANR